MNIRNFAGIAATAFLMAGCASVVDGSTQQITIGSSPDGANCVATNTQGQWPVVTPGTVVVHKSASVLSVRCTKQGWQDATSYAGPRMSATAVMGAMMPYVGLLDAAVDASSGAAMVYPDTVLVILKPLAPAKQASAAPTPDSKRSDK